MNVREYGLVEMDAAELTAVDGGNSVLLVAIHLVIQLGQLANSLVE